MTAYFDEMRRRINEAKTTAELAAIESELLADCDAALAQPWVPESLREFAARKVIQHAVWNRSAEIGWENPALEQLAKTYPNASVEEMDRWEQGELLQLESSLHDVFHAVGHLGLEQTNDNPRNFLRWYANKQQELREEIAARDLRSKGALQ
jgi:hypothetical protein